MTISSVRLELIPLAPAFLRALLAQDVAEARRISGWSFPAGLPEETDFVALRLQQVEATPALQPWLLRAIVRHEDQAMVGHIGFHTAPNPEYLREISPGGVEFGFTVLGPFRRQGYAHEASTALMHWAETEHRVRNFILSIRPDNLPSQGLAKRLGFACVGSHMDEIDGEELVFERVV